MYYPKTFLNLTKIYFDIFFSVFSLSTDIVLIQVPPFNFPQPYKKYTSTVFFLQFFIFYFLYLLISYTTEILTEGWERFFGPRALGSSRCRHSTHDGCNRKGRGFGRQLHSFGRGGHLSSQTFSPRIFFRIHFRFLQLFSERISLIIKTFAECLLIGL